MLSILSICQVAVSVANALSARRWLYQSPLLCSQVAVSVAIALLAGLLIPQENLAQDFVSSSSLASMPRHGDGKRQAPLYQSGGSQRWSHGPLSSVCTVAERICIYALSLSLILHLSGGCIVTFAHLALLHSRSSRSSCTCILIYLLA